MCADASAQKCTKRAGIFAFDNGVTEMRLKSLPSSNRAFVGLAMIALILAMMMYKSLGV
jgi:hypothetical protein